MTALIKKRSLEFLALFLAAAALWWQPFLATLYLAIHSDANGHILLVLPLSIALIYWDGRWSGLNPGRNASGAALLLAALLLRLAAVWKMEYLSPGDKTSLSMLALVIWWFGSVLVCFGSEIFRGLLFPLGFLVLIIPFPDGLLSRTLHFLQYGSAWTAALLFQIVQVPVSRDGVYVFIPGLTLEVAQECSSIRSSMMLLVTTLILAHLFLRSWRTKVLLTLAVIPLALAKNAIRIFTLAELTIHVDPGFMEGRLHHHGGPIFLLLSLFVVMGLLWMLRKSESKTSGLATA